jgi:hypothetical protein
VHFDLANPGTDFKSTNLFEKRALTISLGFGWGLAKSDLADPCVSTTLPYLLGLKRQKFLRAKFFWLEFYGDSVWASDCFCLCVKIFVIVHHTGKSAQMSFSSTHMKLRNLGPTNAFLTRANEHYAANVCNVNAQ